MRWSFRLVFRYKDLEPIVKARLAELDEIIREANGEIDPYGKHGEENEVHLPVAALEPGKTPPLKEK